MGICIRLLRLKEDCEGTIHNVDKIVRYKSNSSETPTSYFRIVSMLVKEPFIFDKTCQPIKLIDSDEKLTPGKLANVSGFGFFSIIGSNWNFKLHSVEVPILDLNIELGGVIKGYVCADYRKNSLPVNAKYHHRGGSLIVDGRLAGIVISNYFSFNPQNLKLFINIAHYRSWIEQHVDQPLGTLIQFNRTALSNITVSTMH